MTPKQKDAPSIEERVAALEAGTGISVSTNGHEADAVPGQPLKQHELYAYAAEPSTNGSAKADEKDSKASKKDAAA
jgi:hypothetical protein